MKMRQAKRAAMKSEAMAPENMDTAKKMAMEKKMGFKAFTPAADKGVSLSNPKKKKKTPKPLPKPSYQRVSLSNPWNSGQSTDPGLTQTAPAGQWKYNTMIK